MAERQAWPELPPVPWVPCALALEARPSPQVEQTGESFPDPVGSCVEKLRLDLEAAIQAHQRGLQLLLHCPPAAPEVSSVPLVKTCPGEDAAASGCDKPSSHQASSIDLTSSGHCAPQADSPAPSVNSSPRGSIHRTPVPSPSPAEVPANPPAPPMPMCLPTQVASPMKAPVHAPPSNLRSLSTDLEEASFADRLYNGRLGTTSDGETGVQAHAVSPGRNPLRAAAQFTGAVIDTTPVVAKRHGTTSNESSPDRPRYRAGSPAPILTEVLQRKKASANLSPLSQAKKAVNQANSGIIKRITKHQNYRLISGLLIALNAVLIAWETEQRSQSAKSNASEAEMEQEAFHFGLMGHVFCILFVGDLVLRMAAERAHFFYSQEKGWNIFDVFVVSFAVLEMLVDWSRWILQSTGAADKSASSFLSKFSMLRVVRLLRIVRTVSSFRLIRFIRELRRMVSSLFGSLRSLAWSVLLLTVVLGIFGIFFTDGAITYCLQHDAMHDESTELLRWYFGTLPAATISLYQAMSGGEDWGNIMNPLYALPAEYRIVFLAFISFAVLALLNVITAVFVEAAMQRGQHDREFVVQEEIEQRVGFTEVMRQVFEEIDSNNNGELTMEEFERHIEDEKIIAYLSNLGIDISEVRTLFELIDKDNSGSVDLEEFVEGCLRLRGTAKSLDLAILSREVAALGSNLKTMQKGVLHLASVPTPLRPRSNIRRNLGSEH